MKKVYDIVVTEGEDKGCFRQTGIESRKLAEEIKSEYYEESCAIVERDMNYSPVNFDELYD